MKRIGIVKYLLQANKIQVSKAVKDSSNSNKWIVSDAKGQHTVLNVRIRLKRFTMVAS